MSQDQEPAFYDEDQNERPLRLGYEGSKVATIMIFAFLAFFIWSIWYVVSNGVPSLQEWLNDPPIDLL